ncbi:MAG: GMC oxidoreductase, partial [Bdellovibrionia bacterium]
PNSIVQKLTRGKDGLMNSATAIHSSELKEFQIRAKAFVLCASTIESTRILLNSNLEKTRGYPVLGKYLNDHIGGPKSLMIEGLFNDQGTALADERQRILFIPRHQNTRGSEKLWPYQRGYTTRVILNRVNRFQLRFTLTAFGEPLPYEKNTVTLDPSRLDRWGSSAVKIHFEVRDNERRMFECMKWDLKKIAESLSQEKGAEISNAYLGKIEPGLCNHEVGTARMGSDPDTSFLNSHSRSHDIENLYVTDGSGFTSLGAANPTLTLMALTYRACRDLGKRI